MWNVVLGGLHSFTYICFFRFQIVFLFDTFDTATGCISTVFQCTSTLLHANDFGTRQTTQFQCTIQVPHRNRHQFIVADVRDGARWQWSLRIIKQHPSNKHTDYSIDYTQIYTSFCTLNCDLLCSIFFFTHLFLFYDQFHWITSYIWHIYTVFHEISTILSTYHWIFAFAFLVVRHIKC